MKHQLRMRWLAIALLFVSSGIAHASAATYYSIRSQSADSARRMVSLDGFFHLPERDQLYGTASLISEFTRTMRAEDITCCLFGDSLTNKKKIVVSGSRIENRADKDWLADYFGLPTGFKSIVTFSPKVDNFILDFNWYLGLDKWWPKWNLSVHAPLTHTRFKLGMKERIVRSSTALRQNDGGHEAGYFTPLAIDRDQLLFSFTEFIQEGKAPNFVNPNQPELAPSDAVIFNPLCYSRIAKRRTATQFSDIYVTIGYDAYQEVDTFLSVRAHLAAPTGTRPNGRYLFEETIGNGHHWELGIGASACYTLWEDEEKERSISLHIDGTAAHLFKTKQTRVFDLVNGDSSRYMLAEKLGTPVGQFLWANPNSALAMIADSTQPSAEFKNVFSPVANLTCLPVDVRINVQGDVSAMIEFTQRNFTWSVGYNFWGRSCEEVCLQDCPTPFDDGATWALKGDSHVYGFAQTGVGSPNLNTDDPIALSATQSKATIHTGLNNFIGESGDDGGIDGLRPTANPGVDNSQFGRTEESMADGNRNISDRTTSTQQTKTSNDPIFLTLNDVSICGSVTQGISHSLFAHFHYTWPEYDDWKPYLGFGGKVEFAQNRSSSGLTTCMRCSLSQWGIWAKAGLAFN